MIEQVNKTSNERLCFSDLVEKILSIKLLDIGCDWALEKVIVEYFFFFSSDIFSFRSINNVKAKILSLLLSNKILLRTL